MKLNSKKGLYLSLIATSIMATSPTFAANREDEVPEPLRLEQSREDLIYDLTDEKILRDFFPLNKSGVKYKEAQLEELRIIESAIKDPEIMFRRINIDPKNNYENKEIYLSSNYISTISFSDKFGEPWPIESYSIPDGLIKDQDLSNSLLILNPTGERTFYKGNMVVMLEGVKSPVMITLEISPDMVDYKANFIVDESGPNSRPLQAKANSGLKAGASSSLQSSFMASYPAQHLYDMLEGITPDRTYEKKTTSLPMEVEVWEKDKVMFVRTKEALISPSLIQINDFQKLKQPNSDTYLYSINSIPVIALSINGKITTVNIR